MCGPILVRVQVRLDDCSQLVVVPLELLRVHQQVVSEFGRCLSQHHTDFHIIIQLWRRQFLVDVHLVFFLELRWTVTHSRPAAQLATLRIFDARHSVRFPPPTVSRLRTRFGSVLAVLVSSFVLWSVSPARRTVCGSTFR